MNTKNGILATAIATVFLIAAVGSASAVCNYGDPGCVGCCNGTTPGVSICFECGDRVTESCTFNESMTCPAGNPGLWVGAEDITINGAGHTMTGMRSTPDACNAFILGGIGYVGHPPTDTNPALHSGIVNVGNYKNVVITNLTIREFCTGIALGEMMGADVDYNEVTKCTIHDCGNFTKSTHGIHMTYTNYSTITENTIYNIDGPGHPGGCSAGGNGVFLFGNMGVKGVEDGNNNTITYNNLSYNNKSGFFTKHMCMYNNFSYNNATGNAQGGITLRCLHSSYNNVSYNNATGNGIWGIYIGGYNNSVYNNTANETGYGSIAIDDEGVGICLCRSNSDNNDLRNNTVCRNEGHGIRIVQDGTGNTLYDNTVCFNGQVTGVDIKDLDATTGDNNTCDTTINYDDIGTIRCTFPCPCNTTNLVITDKTEKWFVNYENYTINYTICNTGKNVPSNISWTSIYINGTLAGVDGPIDPINPGACADERTVGPFDSYGPDDTIRLWADWNGSTGNTTECRENDNNRTNVFGGADLVIEDFDHTWTDLSWKTYDVTYTVRNIGDRPTPVSCEVNFSDITIGGGDWKDCVDPDVIPAELPVGPPVGPRTRTFVMGDTFDWIQVWVNFDHTCPVKVWGKLQHDFDRRGVTYPGDGPCWDDNNDIAKCGDANLDGVVTYVDAGKAYNNDYTCAWAADVDGNGVVTYVDAGKIYLGDLNCCEGCERW